MSLPPIDATKIVLRALRLLDDGRRAAETGWQRLTGSANRDGAPADRRRPPQIW
jgi:hypothetical protein